MVEENTTLCPGALLRAGTYRVVKLLGSGGFGNTYLAEHVLLGKRVAVKEFFASQFCNRDSDGTRVSLALTGKAGVVAKLRKKFIEEARALAELNHPGIVRVSDVFEENGTAYYVMDLIEGKPLSAIVKEKGSLGEKEAVGYIKQVCQALKVVHGKGRLHLDIKPANIMVDGEGRAVLIDFGASKQYDEGSGENTSTFVARTAGYAPLEQGSGSGIKTFSPSTDIYALGATLYKLLSGSTPPDAADLASGEELPPLPDVVSGRTKAAVGAAMSLRRGDRPQSVEEFEGLLGSGVDRQSKEEDERTEIAGVPSSKPRVPSSSGPKSSTPSKSSKSSSKQTSSQEDGINSGKKRKALIGIIVGFAAVVITLGLVLFFGGNGGGSNDVSSATGTIAGHEYVDLGLSVKWATCNIGADSPEEYGNYYAWGETSTKSSYTEENSKTYGKKMGDIGGNASYDAARAKWGSTWRLPTSDEIDELINNCTWTWTTLNGVNGYEVTGTNGNSIFLPAAGYRYSSSLYYAGSYGYYWSSTPYASDTYYAYSLNFYSGNVLRLDFNRYNGRSVRPVSEAANTAVNSSLSGQSENGNATADTQGSQSGAPTTGSMVVNYEPSGATVYVDGTKKGVTPCTVSGVTFGTHKVKIVKIGYESAELSVKVSEGREPQLYGSLEKNVTEQSTSSSSSSSSGVSSATGTIAGHGYVDLGLSVKWATCNVGASSPEDYGNYYAWGETSTKSSYDEENSKTYGKSMGDIGGNVSYDAARANWGSTWRMPTSNEIDELIDKCNWTWTTKNDEKGYKVTSKVNGKSIFLPAAGHRNSSILCNAGFYGCYWSSTPDSSHTDGAYYLYFFSGGVYRGNYYRYRYDGRGVRPVSE